MSRYTTVSLTLASAVGLSSITAINSADVARWINQVEGIIDSHLAARYTLPFSSTPPMIEAIATDMSVFRVVRATHSNDSPTFTEWAQRWNDAIDMLRAIHAGEIELVDSAQSRIAAATTISADSFNRTFKPVFDLRDPISWEIDPDRIDTEDSEV